jgi:hypothetical protein
LKYTIITHRTPRNQAGELGSKLSESLPERSSKRYSD